MVESMDIYLGHAGASRSRDSLLLEHVLQDVIERCMSGRLLKSTTIQSDSGVFLAYGRVFCMMLASSQTS